MDCFSDKSSLENEDTIHDSLMTNYNMVLIIADGDKCVDLTIAILERWDSAIEYVPDSRNSVSDPVQSTRDHVGQWLGNSQASSTLSRQNRLHTDS